jgi:hypothetical protein
VPVTSFTQAEIDAGLVRFVSTDLGRAPSFTVFVSDGTVTVGPQSAQVAFTPGGVLDDPARPKPEEDPGFLRVGGFSGQGNGAGLASPTAVNFVRHPTTPEVIETVGARPVAAAAAPANKPEGVGDKTVLAALDASLGIAPPELSSPGGSDMRVDVVTTRGVDLDRAFDSDVDINAIRLTGMALSVGFVWWALRASGLIASLLASAPAWRHMDPLPVLSAGDKGKRVAWTPKPDVEAEREEQASATVLDRD